MPDAWHANLIVNIHNCKPALRCSCNCRIAIVSVAVICRVFGHFSHRSEWQLVKVDYKSIFDKALCERTTDPGAADQSRGQVSWVGGMESTGGKIVIHM